MSASMPAMPLAFGSGKAARWIPAGKGQMPAELSALLRVAAHDAYSGVDKNGKSYIDGDIGYKAKLFPNDPAIKPLLDKPELKKALAQYTAWDKKDDGIVNGSPARRIFADAAWYATGRDISKQLFRMPLKRADLSNAALARPNVDNGTAEGFQIQADWLGLNKFEFFAFTNWGHDMLPGGKGAPVQLDDGWFNGSSLENAKSNPMHPDYKNTQSVPGMKGFVTFLQNQDKQKYGEVNGKTLDNWFTSALFKMMNRR